MALSLMEYEYNFEIQWVSTLTVKHDRGAVVVLGFILQSSPFKIDGVINAEKDFWSFLVQ